MARHIMNNSDAIMLCEALSKSDSDMVDHLTRLVVSYVRDQLKQQRNLRKSLSCEFSVQHMIDEAHWENMLTVLIVNAGGQGVTCRESTECFFSDSMRVSVEWSLDASELDEKFESHHVLRFLQSFVEELSIELFALYQLVQVQALLSKQKVSSQLLHLSSHILEDGSLSTFIPKLLDVINDITDSRINAISLLKVDLEENTFSLPVSYEHGQVTFNANSQYPLSTLTTRPVYKVIESSQPLLMSKAESYNQLKRINVHQTNSASTYIMPLDLGEQGGILTVSSSTCEMFSFIDVSCFKAIADGFSTIYRENMLQSRTYREANYDNLTGLANRSLFNKFVCELEIKADEFAAILFMDLDKFKEVNDTHGHDVGDKFLQCVGKRIQGQVRDHDLAARFGGDEFVVVLTALESEQDAERVARRILSSFSTDINIDDVTLTPGVSIGVSTFNDNIDVSIVLKRADKALYLAKEGGRGQYRVYEED